MKKTKPVIFDGLCFLRAIAARLLLDRFGGK